MVKDTSTIKPSIIRPSIFKILNFDDFISRVSQTCILSLEDTFAFICLYTIYRSIFWSYMGVLWTCYYLVLITRGAGGFTFLKAGCWVIKTTTI